MRMKYVPIQLNNSRMPGDTPFGAAGHFQITNGTKAAHTAIRPSAIPVMVRYARIVSVH
jgi:hypothetical protein